MEKRIERKIEFPIEFTEGNKTIVSAVFSPVKDSVGVLLVGENFEEATGTPVIRIYLMEKEGETFHCKDEIEAFAFESVDHAVEFAEKLPNISALEILMMMHKQDRMYHHVEETNLYQ